MTKPSAKKRWGIFFLKHFRICCIAVIVALIFVNGVQRESQDSPLPIWSNSMEPVLPAPRWTLVCPGCQSAFDLLTNGFPTAQYPDAQAPGAQAPYAQAAALPRRQACPVCGFTSVPCESASLAVASAKVYMPRLRPRRYELTAFFQENDEQMYLVKRLIGLPGERIEIRSGDIYVNGKILVKTPVQAKQQAISVASIDRVDEPNAVRFVHRKAVPWDNPAERKNSKLVFPVTNECETPAVNQLVKNVEFVRDFLLSFDWIPSELNVPGPVVFYGDGSRRYRIKIGSLSRKTHIDIICCDRQISVLLDGTTMGVKRLPDSPDFAPIAEPFTIRTSNGRVENATVARDIHYSSVPDGANVFDVPRGQYFLLGDNSPVSVDGRFFTPPTVPYSSLIGFIETSNVVVSKLAFDQERAFNQPREDKPKNNDAP
ncbi:MAG: S26 family signal peptidase [Thermoguttaceae bacterium]|nr:S26 family signal peptidase [Thermoguttaceae bacterium]